MSNETACVTRRAKGDGTIFQNKKGRWIARYKRKGFPPKEFSGKTMAEAQAKMDEYKFLVLSGNIVNHLLPLEEYAVKFLNYKSKQVKRGTIKQATYDRIEATYENQIHDNPIVKILMCNLTGKDIQDFIDDLQDKYSYSTIKKCYEFFSALITYGLDDGDFQKDYNPMKTVELPSEDSVAVKTKKIEILPTEDLELFKKIALSRNSAGKLNYRFGPALVFALNTGVREGELITISKNGIMVDKNNHPYLHISETISRVKNRDPKINRKYVHIVTPPKYPRSVRNIPLNPEALHCLKIMDMTYTERNLVRSDFILTTDTGNLPTARHMQDTFDRILKVCNMQHYGTHSLRHTFATKLLEKTKNLRDIKTVAAIMGDDYKVIIKTYLHPDEDNKYDLVASL